MKTKSILMAAAAIALVTTSSAMANSPVPRMLPPTVVTGSDITVVTDQNGNISKNEWLAFQSQKFDELAAASRRGVIHDGHGNTVTKSEWMAAESQKFDEMDSQHTGMISQADFTTEEATARATSLEPAAGAVKTSTSMPPADNQAEQTSYIKEGADGAGGWTAQ